MEENTKKRSAPNFDSWYQTSIVPEKTFSFRWDINDIKSFVDRFEKGELIRGEKFSQYKVNGRYYDFRMVFLPRGRKEETGDGVTVVIPIKQYNEMIKLGVELSVIDNEGNTVKVLSRHIDTTNERGDKDAAFFAYLSHAELFAPCSKLLKEGSLTLACKITFKNNDTVKTSMKVKNDEEFKQNAKQIKDMREMLYDADNLYSDLTIQCSDGSVKCHAGLLAARSQYFNNMFSSNMTEIRTRVIQKKCWDKSLCMALLEYLYTGEVRPDQINIKLFAEADKLNMVELKAECSAHLIKLLSISNCVTFLCAADLHKALGFKNAAKAFVVKNYDSLSTESKDDLKEHPSLVMELFNDMRQQTGPPPKRRRTVGWGTVRPSSPKSPSSPNDHPLIVDV